MKELHNDGENQHNEKPTYIMLDFCNPFDYYWHIEIVCFFTNEYLFVSNIF